MAKRSALARQHHLRLTSSPVAVASSARTGSPLHVRTRLRERRPVSVRRHTARIATRLVVLLVGDIAAMAICVFVADVAANGSAAGGWIAAESAKAVGAGYGAGPLFGPILFLSLVLTGNYSRHRSLNGKVRVLAASALACGFVLWQLVTAGDMQGAVSVYLLATTVTWTVLLGVRSLREGFLSSVWPGSRGPAPAVLK